MTRKVVFVHGRAQENRDSVALKAEWIAAFQAGLDRAGLALPIASGDVRFPYYGDTLAALTAGRDSVPDVIVRGPADTLEREFVSKVVEEIRQRTGITEAQIGAAENVDVVERGPFNWPWARAILKALDANVPNASGASVALATADVYQYLRNPGVRDTIEEGVAAALKPDEPTIIVSHSLGTVVTYNLLAREAARNRWSVPLLVTLGSPLAVRAIRQAVRPLKYPVGVTQWLNAMDPRDIVALYPLDAAHFDVTPAIENIIDVNNDTANRHGISGYLGDARVAARIHAALTA